MTKNPIHPKVHIIIQKESNILLIKRENTGCYDGYWCLPTGRVEIGENPENAAVREAKEEVDLTISPTFVSTIYAKVPNFFDASKPDFIELGFFFKAEKYEGIPKNAEPDKHSEMEWFSIDSLPNPVMPIVLYGLECYKNKNPYQEFGWT